MSDFNLNELIDRALAGREPDPHVIARRLLPKVPQAERDALLASLLVERVTLRMRMVRSARLAAELAGVHRIGETQSSTAPAETLAVDQHGHDIHKRTVGGNSRWSRHFPKMRDRYRVAAGWKFEKDLTAAECDEVAEGYARRAAQNAALEARFRQLAAAVRAAGVNTVGALDALEDAA
jgi:hypothetical protein